ncbi:MAG: ureE [Firmicutes bacterium]|nr:ureE [Bacillota bacterium]
MNSLPRTGRSVKESVIVYEQILGNLTEPAWKQRLEGAVIATLLLDEWEKQKPRLRRTTSDGVEIAINLERGMSMQDGDIMAWDEATKRAVTVKVRANEVLHVRLEPADPMVMVERALKLGHALGNQHWPAVVKGTSIYVPLRVDRRVMATVLKTQNIPGVSYDFEPSTGLNLPYADPGAHGHSHDHGPTAT